MYLVAVTMSVAMILSLASCGIYSKYEKANDVPVGLYGDTDTLACQTDSAGLGSLSWRELFTDRNLQSLIDSALANNTDMQVAYLKVKEAEAALMSAKLAYLPSFAFAPQGTISSFDQNKAIQTYTLPVTASWELDIFGKLRNAKMQSKAMFEQSRDYRQAVQSQLVAAVANNYYTLLMLDEQLDISRSTCLSWEKTVDAMRALVDAGYENEVAVLQLEASLANVRVSILDIEQQINKVENAVSLLIGSTPHHILRGSLSDWEKPQIIDLGVPLSLLSNRPDVKAAERNLEQAFYVTNGARSSFYPSITLSGSAGWTNNSGTGIYNPGKLLATAIGSLTQPLFARGQLSANLKIAKAQQEEASLQFRQTLLDAGVEVNDALTSYQNAGKKTLLYEKQVVSLEKAYGNTMLLMEHGNTTYLEVLTAQQTYLSAMLQQTANRLEEIQGLISLYHALGGGGR
ncbi:MAG: TolC family protein [Prevotella sp.]